MLVDGVHLHGGDLGPQGRLGLASVLRVCPEGGLTRGPWRTLGIYEPLLPPSGAKCGPMSTFFTTFLYGSLSPPRSSGLHQRTPFLS